MILTEDKIFSRFKEIEKVAYEIPPVGGAKIAAMIEYKGKTIAIETNSKKSHPFQKKYARRPQGIYFHAEVAAIKRALHLITPDQIEDSIMYICRVKKNGSWGLSYPCEGCITCLEAFGIRKVYYSTEEGYGRLSL